MKDREARDQIESLERQINCEHDAILDLKFLVRLLIDRLGFKVVEAPASTSIVSKDPPP
jgi:hypothetical protein